MHYVIGSPSATHVKHMLILTLVVGFQLFWAVGPFWHMVYGIWYVVYGMKMAFTVYSYMFRMWRTQASYNIVHLFLVYNIII